jgi:HK97 family phage major capsid protein
MFADFERGYIIVDRTTISLIRDQFTRSREGIIELTARRRVGGRVVLAEAIKVLKCAVS